MLDTVFVLFYAGIFVQKKNDEFYIQNDEFWIRIGRPGRSTSYADAAHGI